MDSIPPRIDEPQPIQRVRWWIHLLLITSYVLVVGTVGLVRNQPTHPVLSHTAKGLVMVSGAELLLFGIVLALAWAASRASIDDLLLRWRGKAMPVLLGVAYSVGLRVAVGIIAVLMAAVLVATRAMTTESLGDYVTKNRPGVENVVDVGALHDNPAYYWLTMTVVSFVVAGLREELWRSCFLAGMKKLWPRQFGSTFGQICAVCIAAVIFGLAHISMGPVAALMAGLLGVGLGLIMVLHRSIWPAVLAHGFFDATSMALIPWGLEMMKNLPKS
jgi:membrane protease YdiL (CAAX protease family)